MPSASFVKQKKTGRYFEGLMRPLLAEMGMEVIDRENLSYREKKGYDCLVRINGASSRIEFKFDVMSGKHLGKVGKTKIFEVWGRERWNKLIWQLEAISEGDDERARLVSFFDN